jgi:hypothetical protein
MSNINITLKPKKSSLDKITLFEKVDMNIFNFILKNREHIFKDNENTEIIDYYKSIGKRGKNKGLKKVKYNKSKGTKYGRVNGNGLSMMRKLLRHNLCREYYMDIDIVNAHPVILSQICSNNGIMSEKLNYYINNRNNILNQIENITNRERGICKILFIMIINGGNKEGWKYKFGVQSDVELPLFVSEFEKEMTLIGNRIIDSNTEFISGLVKNNRKHIIALYLQEWENRVLEVVYTYLNDNGFIKDNIASLCSDGIMIEENNDPCLMGNLNTEVLTKLGFNLEFIVKEMDKTFDDINGLEDFNDELQDIPDILDIEDGNHTKELEEIFNEYKKGLTSYHQEQNIDLKFIRHLCFRYKRNNYELMKRYFEKFFLYFDIDNELQRIKWDRINNTTTKKNKNLEFDIQPIKTDKGISKWMYLQYFMSVPNTEEGRKKNKDVIKKCKYKDEDEKYIHLYVKSCFLKRWYEDEDRNSFTDLVFEPNINDNNPNEYNVFNGFNYKKINIDENPKEDLNKLFSDYLDYIKKYNCSDDDEIFNFYISHLSHLIQYPHVKNEICYIFYSSKKGTNKSSTIEFINDMVGQKYVYTGNGREILDKHSVTCNFALINTLEELSNKLSIDHYERIKDNIQRKKNLINEKFKNLKKNNDYVRYFITTNKTDSIGIDSDTRRFNVLSFTRADEGTEEFNKISKLLKKIFKTYRNEMLKMFGEYLENYDFKTKHNLSPYNPLDWSNNSKCSDDIKFFYKIEQIDNILTNIYRNNFQFMNSSVCQKNIVKDKLRIKLNDLYDRYGMDTEGRGKYSKDSFRKHLEETKECVKMSICGGYKICSVKLINLHKYLLKNNIIQEPTYINYYTTKKEDDNCLIDEDTEEIL